MLGPPPLPRLEEVLLLSLNGTLSDLSTNGPLQVLENKAVRRRLISHLRAWLGGSFPGATHELPLGELIPLPPHL